MTIQVGLGAQSFLPPGQPGTGLGTGLYQGARGWRPTFWVPAGYRCQVVWTVGPVIPRQVKTKPLGAGLGLSV